jgi:hypothetical protein
MEEVARPSHTQTFNGALEAGVRAIAVLGAAFPAAYDIQRLTAYDYLLVNTAQLGGPEDLHPASIINAPVSQVRRNVVQNALRLMMTRGLVELAVEETGMRYRAGETAALFLETLETDYALELKARAEWLVSHLANYTDAEFEALMKRFFNAWVVEFQAAERSLAGDA